VISVVIITRNEAENIVDCIVSAKKISNDILVIDTGSSDETIILAGSTGARISSVPWSNYGEAKNTGARLASNDWILSLDADERVTDSLAGCISKIDPGKTNKIYGFRRLNFFGKQRIDHGPLGHDRVFRLYNRRHASWDFVAVHEKLVGGNLKRNMLNALVEHYGNINTAHYLKKKLEYARLWAIKHQQQGKKGGFFVRISSTAMSFIKAYILQAGFLDRKNGLLVSKINAYYTWYKYHLLQKGIEAEKEKLHTNSIKPGERTLSFRENFSKTDSMLP
jgi:(heptosyl)LPS beta-1,4-glucosyltransferase